MYAYTYISSEGYILNHTKVTLQCERALGKVKK